MTNLNVGSAEFTIKFSPVGYRPILKIDGEVVFEAMMMSDFLEYSQTRHHPLITVHHDGTKYYLVCMTNSTSGMSADEIEYTEDMASNSTWIEIQAF